MTAIPASQQEQQVAVLETINYEWLVEGNQDEAKKVIRACEGSGIFYLDLSGPSTIGVLNTLQNIYTAAKQYFHLPHEVLMAGYREGVERG